MTEPIEGELAVCPYCGEQVELSVERYGAESEQYVEDCPVCCRPWTVNVQRSGDDEGDGAVSVTLGRDDD